MYFLSTKQLRSYLSYFIFSTFGINWYWYGDEICMVGMDKSKTILWCDSIGLSIADPLEKYCKKLVLTVGMSPIAAGFIRILVCVLIGRYTRINHFTSTTTTSNGQNKVIRSNNNNNNNNNQEVTEEEEDDEEHEIEEQTWTTSNNDGL